jgi:hypothetical protein
MLKRSIETLIQKYKDANAYDPRLDPNRTGWYFPGQRDLTADPLPPIDEGPYLDSEEMVRLIEEGIAKTEREIASTALTATVDRPTAS